MSLTVLLGGSWEEKHVSYLEELLHPDVTIIRESGKKDFDILVCGRPDEKTINASPELKHLIIPWAGLSASTADLMASYRNISVHNIHHNAVSTAELALSLMLAAARLIVPADLHLRKGDWSFRYHQDRSVLISGSRILILGYGHIGRSIGTVCMSMGADVSGIKRSLNGTVQSDGVTLYPALVLHELLRTTDILVVTLPLTPETEGIIGDKELDILHERSIVVNVGRGRLIDERSLYEHLRDGFIGAAGIDVWYNYPSSGDKRTPPSCFPFDLLDNVVMTPHMGGAFGADRIEKLRMQHIAFSINRAAEGKEIPGRIDLSAGY